MLKGSNIHNVFHASFLKRALGKHIIPSKKLPLINANEKMVLIPKVSMDVKEMKLRNRSTKEYLIWWEDLLMEDAMWEGPKILEHLNLQLLEEQ